MGSISCLAARLVLKIFVIKLYHWKYLMSNSTSIKVIAWCKLWQIHWKFQWGLIIACKLVIRHNILMYCLHGCSNVKMVLSEAYDQNISLLRFSLTYKKFRGFVRAILLGIFDCRHLSICFRKILFHFSIIMTLMMVIEKKSNFCTEMASLTTNIFCLTGSKPTVFVVRNAYAL